MAIADLFNGVSLKRLESGEHQAILKSYRLVENKTDASKSYVELIHQLEDRTLTDNRFERSFPIALSQIKQQFGIADQTIETKAVLGMMHKQSYRLWVSYVPQNGKTYMNINFLPPIMQETDETNANAEAEPF